jgi:GNAT superfamily N-acetyltransferase
MLGREGWVGVLGLGDTLTVAVPESSCAARIEACFANLPQSEVTAEAFLALLPTRALLGPADLFYPPATLFPAAPSGADCFAKARLEELKGMLAPNDFEESGLEYVDSDLFALPDAQRRVIAACGYERWPAGIAHLCIATAPNQRRRGLARRVAQAALATALSEGLLPQWRARLEPSKALARALGFERWGFQFSALLTDC